MKRAFLMAVLVAAVVLVYSRLFHAGFSGLDDDLNVYANPYLNPPTLSGLAMLWRKPYDGLYVPLAYTIFAAAAHFAQVPSLMSVSLGQTITVNPAAFHWVNIAFHCANSVLCFLFVRRIAKADLPAAFGALVFAIHPMQVESVAWISELRGLSAAFFALIAVNFFLASRSRPAADRLGCGLLATAASLAFLCGMLCKPSIIALPLACTVIDRIVFASPWRKALPLAGIWCLCAVPFVLITRSVQAIGLAGQSLPWQRPFIAGDAAAFYLVKLIAPVPLCVDYGRTPHALMSHPWAYLSWLVPIISLVLAYKARVKYPMVWLGTLLFVIFLLPVSGLAPFAFQAYSTVADRYAYLSFVGVALIVADVAPRLTSARPSTRASLNGVIFGRVVACGALSAFAVISYHQTQYWISDTVFLKHTVSVNPNAAFALNGLGERCFALKDYAGALRYYQECIARNPGHVSAYVNAAEVYFRTGDLENAIGEIRTATRRPEIDSDNYSDIGLLLMKMNDHPEALRDFRIAIATQPDSPKYLLNYAIALSADGQLENAEGVYRHCIAVAPGLAGAHTGLGIVLAQTNRLPEALAEFQTAVRLQPSDPAALSDLSKAQALMGAATR